MQPSDVDTRMDPYIYPHMDPMWIHEFSSAYESLCEQCMDPRTQECVKSNVNLNSESMCTYMDIARSIAKHVYKTKRWQYMRSA